MNTTHPNFRTPAQMARIFKAQHGCTCTVARLLQRGTHKTTCKLHGTVTNIRAGMVK